MRMFLVAVFGLAVAVAAQGTRADYERAGELGRRLRDKVARAEVQPTWIGGGPRFWYRVDLGEGRREFVRVDPAAAARTPLFDHAWLAAALEIEDAQRLPLEQVEVDAEGEISFTVRPNRYRLAAAGKLLKLGPAPRAAEPTGRRGRGRRGGDGGATQRDRGQRRAPASADGAFTVFAREGDLYLRAGSENGEVRLTTDGGGTVAYDPRVTWSPDGKRFVTLRTDTPPERRVHLIESSPKDQLQPKLQDHSYAKPGDPLPSRKPCLFEADGGKEVPIDDALFATPWSIGDLRWAADGKSFTFLYNQRGHQVLRIVAVDAATGAARALVEEAPKTFVDYAHKTFSWWLDATGELIWMSERDGWNHLYLMDAATGAVKRQLTRGRWVVRGVDHVDETAREVWFRAMGVHRGQDPYHVHFARVALDTGEITMLTKGDGTHDVAWAPDRSYYVDGFSRVDAPPVFELRRARDGAHVLDLERADVSALMAAGWRPPERFVAKARDGETDIWGMIWTPTNFDPAKRYPVIESIYAGPHGAHVPKTFAAMRGEQAMAELGFVLVKIDGMGTNWRSKAFHDVAWQNLGDSGLPDRIAWMKAAAATRPWMDLDHVGIYGGSAGGQSALRAMLAHGDFYKAAAADCGCHDNRMDKVWWNELWMGYPVGPHYAEQSNVTQAHKLTGKLLLTVGELDRNVDPASTMQVVNALIAADKDFELIVFPGGGHGAGGSPYGQRRRNDFFVRSLLGVEPRAR